MCFVEPFEMPGIVVDVPQTLFGRLFGVVLVVYAGSDWLLHESGLLAVTVMGLVIANAHLPSFTELQRFKDELSG